MQLMNRLLNCFFVFIVTLILLGGGFVFFPGDLSAQHRNAPPPEANPFAPDVALPEEEDTFTTQRITPQVRKGRKVVYQPLAQRDTFQFTEEELRKSLTNEERAILAKEPETGPELLEAGIMIARVGRPALAKKLIEKSLEDEGNPDEYATVFDRLGTDKALYLVANPVIGPLGSEAVEKAMASAKKHWQRDDVVSDAIKKVSLGTEKDRVAALLAVRKGGSTSITQTMALLDSNSPDDWDKAKILIELLGSDAIDSLIAQLLSTDVNRVENAAKMLGQLRTREGAFALLTCYYDSSLPESLRNETIQEAILTQFGNVESPQTAFDYYLEQAENEFYHRNFSPTSFEEEGTITITKWDDRGKPLQEAITSDAYRRYLAVSAARKAFHLSSLLDNPEKETHARNLFAVTLAEEILYSDGLDAPIDTTDFTSELELTPSELDQVVGFALKTGHYVGAIIPVVEMGKSGEKSLCYGTREPTTLIQAVTAPNRRLRFMALAAVIRLDPDRSYNGSGRVLDSLLRFTTSRGIRKVVVASPKVNDAMARGHQFALIGYQVIPVTNGNDLIAIVQNDADVEAVMTSPSLSFPPLHTVLESLQADYRTADIPIAVDANENNKSFDVVESQPQGTNVAELLFPYNSDAAQWVLDQLFELTQLQSVPVEVRRAQGVVAADFVRQLVEKYPQIYQIEDREPLIRRFLDNPDLVPTGFAMALLTGTTGMQNHLVNLIGDVRRDTTFRNTALDAFTNHLKKFGVLLRDPDIDRLYDRYNAGVDESKESQEVLGKMLDAYESVK